MAHQEQSEFDYVTYEKTAPAVVRALRALGTAVSDSGLDHQLTELVKLRVSQINGCAFCLQLHLNLARKACVAPAKIDLMATWREVDIFSARERTALAWAEALTRMGQQAVPDALYAELRRHFSATETAFLTAAIGTTNAWNRVAGGLRFPPPIPTAEPAAKENTT